MLPKRPTSVSTGPRGVLRSGSTLIPRLGRNASMSWSMPLLFCFRAKHVALVLACGVVAAIDSEAEGNDSPVEFYLLDRNRQAGSFEPLAYEPL
eukprot:5162627-Prymnesium_polylepis.1